MNKFEQTVKDAEEFINNMKKFHGEKELEQRHANNSDYHDHSGFDDPDSREGTLNTDSPPSETKFLPFKVNFTPAQRFNNTATPGETAFRADLLTFLEVHYFEHKKLPQVTLIHRHFAGHPNAPKTLKAWAPILDGIADSLQNRGLLPYKTTDDYIDPKFAWAVSLVVNTQDKRTIAAKLKESGLSSREWQAFLRRKRYHDYFQSRLDEVFTEDVKNDAKVSLARLVNNGDLGAIKYYNELTNIYRPESADPNRMIAVVLTSIMEILATHVSSEILNKIAAEIRDSPSVLKVINSIEATSR